MSAHRQPSNACGTHRLYGLSCEDYDGLIERSDNTCEICGIRAEDTKHGTLRIDHDGTVSLFAVRGLLCSRCNTCLESGRGIPAGARAAYLARPPWQNASGVTTKRKKPRTTPLRTLQVDDEPWRKFGDATKAARVTRGDALREIIDWTNADPELWVEVRQIATIRGKTMRGAILGALRQYVERNPGIAP